LAFILPAANNLLRKISMPSKPLRLAVVGGQRGGSFTVALEYLKRRLVLTAVCDLSEQVQTRWKGSNPDIAVYGDYDKMLKDDVCDAVIVATPMQVHAQQAVAAMKAGKHVLSEVTACISHKEAISLVETVEKTGMTYMMAENYTYMRPHMMILNMVRKGVFGELTYAEGMYLHDCRTLYHNADGSLTWRGQLKRDQQSGNLYPTHSLGPIAQWLDINSTDAFDTVYSVTSRAAAMADYTKRKFKNDPGTDADYWSVGDSNSTLLRTTGGKIISLRFDATSARPHHMANHELQGTHACFRTTPDHREPLIWIDGKSKGSNPATKKSGHHMEWEGLYSYAKSFEHPRWKKQMAIAEKAGHGGGDFFELEDFVNAIDGKEPNPIDVYKAVTWSSILWHSQESERTGKPVKAFDYKNRKKK